MRFQLLLLASMFIMLSTTAQNSVNYSAATSTTGSLTNMSSGTTQLIGTNTDDAASSVTNLNFDFFFMGTRYAQFSVSPNGVLRLGATAVTTNLYEPLGQAGQAMITAYGADQRTHITGKVHYKITGTAPNRILIVEWLNMQSAFNTGGTADLTYQVRLYETTGVIEFVYGSMTMSAAGAADVVNLQYSASVAEKLSILITDLNGKPVLQQTVYAGVGNNTLPVNVTTLPKGTYFIKLAGITSHQTVQAVKVIKQ